MKLKYKTINNIEKGVLIGLICAVVLSFAGFDSACDNLRSSVLRLHILANSDSKADQEIKLKVRDQILKETGIFESCNGMDSALKAAEKNIPKIEDTARRVLIENGFDYDVSVSLGDSSFDTREYDNFTLPAGTYKSLIVKLGKAQGHNWWCVLYPAVCVPAASKARLDESASDKSAFVAEHPQKYIMKFKAAEWYEDIKHIFKSRFE